MSTMTTARIPDELYDQGMQRLEALGMGTTDLIRAAFKYLVATGNIPEPASASTTRAIDTQQKQEFASKLAGSRLNIDLPADWDYKEELARGKWEDYEALA